MAERWFDSQVPASNRAESRRSDGNHIDERIDPRRSINNTDITTPWTKKDQPMPTYEQSIEIDASPDGARNQLKRKLELIQSIRQWVNL